MTDEEVMSIEEDAAWALPPLHLSDTCEQIGRLVHLLQAEATRGNPKPEGGLPATFDQVAMDRYEEVARQCRMLARVRIARIVAER